MLDRQRPPTVGRGGSAGLPVAPPPIAAGVKICPRTYRVSPARVVDPSAARLAGDHRPSDISVPSTQTADYTSNGWTASKLHDVRDILRWDAPKYWTIGR